ncbi:elongation factor G [Fibrobacterota bacterium]
MKEYKTSDIRNFSVVGSSQVGKTSLGDAILYNSGAASRQGNVEDGSSYLDYQQDEIEKKISISSSLFSVETGKGKINFIDTPGYPAFVSQAATASNVCENALVVLDASSGVEILTKKVWRRSHAEGQSRFLFLNKMDHERVDFNQVLNQAKEVLSKKVCPVCIPIGSGDSFSGIVDVISQKAYMGIGKDAEEQEVPDDLKAAVQEYRSELLEAAAENSEELLDKYLEDGTLNNDDLIKGMKLGITSNDLIPLMVGSARKNIGITRTTALLDQLAPSPDEKKKPIISNDGKNYEPNPAEPTLLQLFKITDEEKIGEYFFFKVCQGSVRAAQELINTDSGQKERIGHMFIFSGKNRDEIGVLHAGDIGATPKLKSVKIGDSLSVNKNGIIVSQFNFPHPVMSQTVQTDSEKDNEKLIEGLQAARRVDPCFVSEHRPEFNELVVSGINKLHIDTIMEKIKSKLNISFSLSKPRIPYRETIRGTAKAQGKYKKQTGGHGQYGDAQIEILPRGLGEGYLFVDNISGGVIPSKYIPAVDKGIRDAMSKGILAGFPVVDVEVRLFYGSYHSVDSSDLAFQMAGILAFKKATEQAKPILLEPIMNVKVTVPESSVGDVSADFNQRRGKIMGMDPQGDYTVLNALVPMVEMHSYSVDLQSITKGDSEYTETLEKYEPVPSQIAEKVIKENQKKEE